MQAFERYLIRWRSAGLLDEATEASIRAFESADTQQSGQRWQVILSLILGVILLEAGILLFVAAHWDEVSPGWRLTLVLAILSLFHLAGLAARNRFDGFATAMHALGTLTAGAAIALVGQIFHMQEHWPTSVLLWALSALAGWWLLEDQFQQTLALLLVPAWLISEWSYRASAYHGSNVYLGRMIAVLAAVYLTALLHSRRRIVFGILFGAAGVALGICVNILADGWNYHGYGHSWIFLPLWLRVTAFAILVISAGFGWCLSKRSLVPVAAIAVTAFVLPWAQRLDTRNGDSWQLTEPNLAAYALVAGTCVFLTWWGVRENSKALVNYAIAAFAMTVMWFYFSSVMDKLGRSLGLIVLGVLFLAGGWMLETMRRKLVRSIPEIAQ